MTPQKAIECIDEVLCATVHYDETLAYELTTDDTEWLEMAKEALEKLIPQKPVFIPLAFETEDGERVSPVQCTACKGFFANNKETKCCPFCGQKLDWGDTE